MSTRSSYLPSYSEGARIGIQKIIKYPYRKRSSNINEINFCMDSNLKGHPYVKSAIDIACWDILEKSLMNQFIIY